MIQQKKSISPNCNNKRNQSLELNYKLQMQNKKVNSKIPGLNK